MKRGKQSVGSTVWLVTLVVGLALATLGNQVYAQDSGGDWDWGAFEAMEDTPVTGKSESAAPAKTETPPVEAVDFSRSAENAAPDLSAPRRPAYPLFAGLPPFEVIPSQRDSGMHPCSNCHQWVISNPEPRELNSPHDKVELEHGFHGKAGFWCFACHDLKNGSGLKTLEGEAVDLADAYVVCSQCHSSQAYDWANGAHGKRVGDWQGTRQVLSCTACHYQHRPAFDPRKPMAGPEMRVGLPRPEHWVPLSQREHAAPGHKPDWRSEVQAQQDEATDESATANPVSKQTVKNDEAS